MRLFITIILLLIFSSLSAQDSLNIPLSYTEVIKLDSSITQAELYSRARSWFVEAYRSAKDVIQMDDKENAKIMGKGNIQYRSHIFVGSEGTKGWISYTISIQFKQGRYKYDITNFIHEGNPLNTGGQFSFGLITESQECPYKIETWASKGWRNKVWKDIRETIQKDIPPLVESLKKAMEKPSENKSKEW